MPNSANLTQIRSLLSQRQAEVRQTYAETVRQINVATEKHLLFLIRAAWLSGIR